jgi:hypothetical protein
MSNLAILSIWVSRGNFNFDKPESIVRPKRDTCRAVARCWQREVTDLPRCGNTSNLPSCGTRPTVLEFSKPEIAIRSSRDAAKDGMGQRELTDLALWSNHSNLTGPIVRAYSGKPDVAI